MDNKNLSMIDVAYKLMKKKKKWANFNKIWDETSQIMGLDEETKKEKISMFYTGISLDGRFITVGDNRWDLRERNKYDDVHIDMRDIYREDEEEALLEVDDEDADELLGDDDDEKDDGLPAYDKDNDF